MTFLILYCFFLVDWIDYIAILKSQVSWTTMEICLNIWAPLWFSYFFILLLWINSIQTLMWVHLNVGAWFNIDALVLKIDLALIILILLKKVMQLSKYPKILILFKDARSFCFLTCFLPNFFLGFRLLFFKLVKIIHCTPKLIDSLLILVTKHQIDRFFFFCSRSIRGLPRPRFIFLFFSLYHSFVIKLFPFSS